GKRQVGDETVEEVQKALLAETLGDRGGRAHVDEQQNALLTTRVVIAPRDEGEEHARAKQIVDAQQQIVADTQREREDDVGAGDADRQIDDDEHEQDNAQIQKRAQREIGQKRQLAEGRAVSAPQHQNLDRREDAPVQAARQRAAQLGVDKIGDAVRPVLRIGEQRAQQAGAEGDQDDKAKRVGGQHRWRAYREFRASIEPDLGIEGAYWVAFVMIEGLRK